MHHRTLLSLAALAAFTTVAGAQGVGGGRMVTVMASDYTFQAPDTIPAGLTTFRLLNRGSELHHMQVVRLEQEKTYKDFEAALKDAANHPGPPPAWFQYVGGPNAGIPDGKSAVTVTANLPAGNYVLLCMIPSPDGMPHIGMGMFRSLTVIGPAAAATAAVEQAGAPGVDAVMTLYDYNFDLDKPLTAGRRTILIRNTATQFHEAFLVRLPPGVSATALLEWMHGGMNGPPPVVPMGGIVGISRGEENLLTVDLEPGNYALYCFLPDAKDGKEHVVHGMFKPITVSR